MLSSKIKYCLNEIKKNWRDRLWWKNRFIHYVIKKYYKIKGNDGCYVYSIDNWDNLLILDACRYDSFIKILNIKKCKYIITRGTETPEFLKENFTNKYFNDIVYVTANPWVDIICKKSFYKIISVWKYRWDEELGTVHPWDMVVEAIKARKKYPDKKLIVHFLQPHNPYLFNNIINRLSYDAQNPRKNPTGIILTKPFKAVERGIIPVNKLYEAYLENLKIVLIYAIYLARKLKGRTIITSDHGEAFGEKLHPLIPIRIYGHPSSVRIPVLVKVPWYTVDNKLFDNFIDVKHLKKQIIYLNNKIKNKNKSEEKLIKDNIKRLKHKF